MFPLDRARVYILWLILHMKTHLPNAGILNCDGLGPHDLSGQGTVSYEWKIRVASVLDLSASIPPP